MFRFGSGYTLQAKINPLDAGINNPDTTPKTSLSPLLPVETSTQQVSTNETEVVHHTDRIAATGRGETYGAGVDTRALKSFIEESFQGALLMEEHQVSF